MLLNCWPPTGFLLLISLHSWYVAQNLQQKTTKNSSQSQILALCFSGWPILYFSMRWALV